MVLSVLVKYWCIYHYQKCKLEDVKLGMIKVVLIIVYSWKKVINIALKSEMSKLFWDNILLQMA